MRSLRFFKMSGSGNDFVVVDARTVAADELTSESAIQALCARGTGIGADGLVLLQASPGVDFRMAYYNADGSRASMCGNAALCCTRLATELGAPTTRDLIFETDAGRMKGRMRDGQPEIDLTAVRSVEESFRIATQSIEERIGFALAGVPHLVVLCQDVERVDVETRGRMLRSHPSVMPEGANANFVSRDPTSAGWRMRTFERGVEGETLACGTGAVASAVLLTQWRLADGPVELRTRSGRTLTVRFDRAEEKWMPSLAGEGRIVFEGLGREIEPARNSVWRQDSE